MLVRMQFLLYKRLFYIVYWLSSPQRVALFSAMTGSKVRTSGSIHLQYSVLIDNGKIIRNHWYKQPQGWYNLDAIITFGM